MSPKIVDKKQKKLDIAHAAMYMFSEKGVEKTKMIDIAQKAGVGKGTIYEYFSSKTEIFTFVSEYLFENMLQDINSALKGKNNPLDKLKVIVFNSLNYFNSHHMNVASLLLEFWVEGTRTKAIESGSGVNLSGVYNDYRNLIADIVKDGMEKNIFIKVDPYSYASVLIASLDGLLLQILMMPKRLKTKELEKTIELVLIAGIINPNRGE